MKHKALRNFSKFMDRIQTSTLLLLLFAKVVHTLPNKINNPNQEKDFLSTRKLAPETLYNEHRTINKHAHSGQKSSRQSYHCVQRHDLHVYSKHTGGITQ